MLVGLSNNHTWGISITRKKVSILYNTLYVVPQSQGAQAWITVLPAITPMPAFTS